MTQIADTRRELARILLLVGPRSNLESHRELKGWQATRKGLASPLLGQVQLMKYKLPIFIEQKLMN